MSSPSIHLPDVSLPDLSRIDVSDRAGDLVSSGVELVQEVATAAFELAGGLAAAAIERIPDLPEKAIDLAGAAIPSLRPKPKRSKKPFVLIAVILVVVAGGVWFKRRRASGTPDIASTYTSSADPGVSAAS
jgi:hypothetical protein